MVILRKARIALAMLSVASFIGCQMAALAGRADAETAPNVVTADIEAGIERHIAEETRKGNGYFRLAYEDKELNLKLVRVHTEYLSSLGPRRHFACVDLVDTKGDVYDVDFFLAGEPGSMRVTETTVHKINGQPFYLWAQRSDGTWHRVPAEEGSHELLGVVRGNDEFDFLYSAVLPQIDGEARMWIPLARTDAFQIVEIKQMKVPGDSRVVTDEEHGNRILYAELGPEDSGKRLRIRYHVRRREKAAYRAAESEANKFLRPERLVPLDQTFQTIAQTVTAGKEGDLVRARAIYDHVVERMQYIKYGSGWGQGNATYACNARTGNCTDFHAYFIALARAVGIPARFAIGAGIPSSRDDGGVDGYHCWVEFYADGKWWPVDISEADKYSSLSTYYFGHHPANRLEFSRGRDLQVDPAPASGPINFLAYPLLEIDGKPVKVDTWFAFRRGDAGQLAGQPLEDARVGG